MIDVPNGKKALRKIDIFAFSLHFSKTMCRLCKQSKAFVGNKFTLKFIIFAFKTSLQNNLRICVLKTFNIQNTFSNSQQFTIIQPKIVGCTRGCTDTIFA